MYHLAAKMAGHSPVDPCGRSCKGGKDEDEHHGEHEEGILGEGSPLAFLFRQENFPLCPCRVILPKNEGHEQSGNDRENDRPNGPGQTQLPPQYSGRENNRQHIDCGAGIEKCRCRADPGAACVDSSEQRKHGAGTDRKHGPRNGGNGIGQYLARLCPEIFQDRGLGDKDGNGARDKKGGDQAGEHMLPGIFLQHQKGFQTRPANHGTCPGYIVGCRKEHYDYQQLPSFFHDLNSFQQPHGRIMHI